MATENEILRTKAAIQTVQTLLNNKELWFELEVVALELNDAREDMNDALRGTEDSLRLQRTRPGWIPLPDYVGQGRPGRPGRPFVNEALLWNGQTLLYDNGETVRPLLEASERCRLRALEHLQALWEELFRPR